MLATHAIMLIRPSDRRSKKAGSTRLRSLTAGTSSALSAGNRITTRRISAMVRTADAQWAGLWMRVDKGPNMVAFDNMQNRSIKGTSGWQEYEVVLDVP